MERLTRIFGKNGVPIEGEQSQLREIELMESALVAYIWSITEMDGNLPKVSLGPPIL